MALGNLTSLKRLCHSVSIAEHLEDSEIAAVPESTLTLSSFQTEAKSDLARMLAVR